MKQAILITAYKNFNHLQRIIDHFDTDYSFYIHIDKKSTISENEIFELKKNKRVFVSKKFTTHWGGISHLKSILLLMKMALEDKELEYIHSISGHDFPIKSSSFFKEFLLANKGKQFMEHFDLPSKNWAHGGMDRLHYYNLYDQINAKGRYSFLIQKFINFQKKVKIKRKINLGGMKFYGGSTWWTLSYDCCLFADNYVTKNPSFLKRFNYTFCAEEIFFHTLILNSPFKTSVMNDNLRHIVWEERNGNIPAVLDESDYSVLKETEKLFARRFEYPISEKLINLLETKKA